jgi:serine protease
MRFGLWLFFVFLQTWPVLAAALPLPPARLIVQWRQPADAGDALVLQQLVADHRLPLRHAAGSAPGWQRWQLDGPLDAAQLGAWAERLRADPRLAAVLQDRREQRQSVTPNDQRFGEQWWLQTVAAGREGVAGFASAWQRSTGAPAFGAVPVVAVLDSGITSHPELNARLRPGYDFVSDTLYANDGNGRDNDPADPGDAITTADRLAHPAALGGCPPAPLSSWHGTVIAGQVAAVSNNVEGVAAGNWQGLVLPVRVAGRCGAALGDILDGLRWAAGLAVPGVPANLNPARIVVLSYGGSDPCDLAHPNPEIAATARLYTDVIAELRAAGTLVIVAAGNGRSTVGRPAACAGAFGVTATNREGFKATYANFGPGLALATPGGDAATGGTCDAQLADSGIVSTGNLGDVQPGAAGYAAASGTSFAAPAVAAVAALMLAVRPGSTLAELEDGLKRSARPHVRVPLLGACSTTAVNRSGRCECSTASCGAGLLDADEALRYAADPAAYAAPVRAAPLLDHARLRACATLLGNPPPEPPPGDDSGDDNGGGSGGGSMPPLLLLGLALAAALLRRR